MKKHGLWLAVVLGSLPMAACSDDDGTGVVGECGNAIIEGDEQCDRYELGGASCQTVVPGSNGTLGCTLDCLYDTAACLFTTCGDGVAEGTEQCDGADLQGQTCAGLIPGSSGELACGATCTFDTVGCSGCGDGVKAFDEQCDCGTDPSDLPEGCNGPNGAVNSHCSESCTFQSYCGDGVRDAGEECDCGDDPQDLPVGCFDVNGGASASVSCEADCTSTVQCSLDVWETCPAGSVGMCCEDEYQHPTGCTQHPTAGTAYCLRSCGTTTDCYWSNHCRTELQPAPACWPQVCGPNWPDTEMNAYCTVTGGGGAGWCLPIYRRDDPTDEMFGICIEAGTIAHGGVCDKVSIDLADRSVDQCDMGLCLAAQGATTGECAQFCDWQEAYDVAIYGADPTVEELPCPAGYNCFTESYLDPVTGNRSGDLGYCRPTAATDPTAGFTTCSLVTSELLSDPSQTCADAGFTSGRCTMVSFSGGEQTDGSLVGICAAGSAATLGVWDACSTSTSCPPGTACVSQDAFASPSIGPTVCVPYCDTAHHDGVTATCADLGAVPTVDGTPTCQSVSNGALPDGPSDLYQSRLGYCVIP